MAVRGYHEGQHLISNEITSCGYNHASLAGGGSQCGQHHKHGYKALVG
ncbi:MAG: hypothetical protein ACMUEM_02030 [Flavobacteriales bacterium AspAUS03]